MGIAAKIIGVLFLAGAVFHIVRMVRPFTFIIGPYHVPPWLSLPFVVGEAWGGLILLNVI
jgi:hypothetical protein